MSKILKALAISAALLAPVSAAHAGVYADDLSRCLVKATTPQDQTNFMVWMFAALSAHPAVKAHTNFTDAEIQDESRKTSVIFQRLLFQDCHKESVDAIKYEGPQALAASFNVFGQAAMRGLMGDPHVAQVMSDLDKYVDKTKMAGLLAEGGVKADAKAK